MLPLGGCCRHGCRCRCRCEAGGWGCNAAWHEGGPSGGEQGARSARQANKHNKPGWGRVGQGCGSGTPVEHGVMLLSKKTSVPQAHLQHSVDGWSSCSSLGSVGLDRWGWSRLVGLHLRALAATVLTPAFILHEGGKHKAGRPSLPHRCPSQHTHIHPRPSLPSPPSNRYPAQNRTNGSQTPDQLEQPTD